MPKLPIGATMKTLAIFLVFTAVMVAKPLMVSVSIVPQKSMVEKIGKDLVDINLLVSPGSSPHGYEPKPKQMTQMAHSTLYLAIGVEFESAWLAKFQDINPNMRVVYLDKGITKVPIAKHRHEEEEENKKEETGLDPHIWTSLENAKIIAKNIAHALIAADPNNSSAYEKNYQNYLQEIETTQKEIQEILLPHKNRAFAVFHPSWGYFAKEFHLEQVAIEIEGKSPKAKQLISLIKELQHDNIKTLFTQPEFSKKSALVIAKEIGGEVTTFSPLASNYLENLVNFAKAIDKGYSQ